MSNHSAKNGSSKNKSSKRLDIEESLQEIQIDEVMDQVDLNEFVSFMDLDEARNKVFPSLGPDGELRYSKFVEMPQNNYKQSWYKKCWRKLFQPQNDMSHITRTDMVNFKMRRILNEFAFEKQQEHSRFQVIQQYLSFIKVIEPKSYFYITWQIANALIVLILAFEVPLVTFFEIKFDNTNGAIHYIRSIVAFSLIIFFFDVIISFNTAYYLQGKLELDRSKIAEHYIRTELLFDIIPIIGLTIQLVTDSSLFYIASSFIFFKFYELFKFSEQVHTSLRLHRRLLAIWQLTQLIIWIILICHLFACFFYYVGNIFNKKRENSWFGKIPVAAENTKDKYLFAFYWAVTTMVSVGYGDLTPVQEEEVLVAVFTMFVSCILFAYSINYIWEVVREANESRYNFERQSTALNRFMYYNGVSRNLRTRIDAYLVHMWEADKGRDTAMEQDMINRLGPELKEELIFESMGLILQRSSLFQDFSQDFLKELAQDVEEVRYSEGEKIFSSWEPEWDDLSLYYILAGSVEIYLQRGQESQIIQLQVLRSQQTFGHIGFIGGVERTASAKCITYSRIYKLSRENFLIRLESYPDDKQHFHELRSKLIFSNKMKYLGLKCFVCESDQHIVNDCDKTHLVIDKDQLIFEQNKLFNTRVFKQRRTIKEFHAYKNMTYIQNEVRYAQRFFRGLSFHTRESEQSIDEDLENEQDYEQGHESEELLEINDSRVAVQSQKDNLEQFRQTGTFEALKMGPTGSFQEKNLNFLEDSQLNKNFAINNGSILSVGQLEMEVPAFQVPVQQKPQPLKMQSPKISPEMKPSTVALQRKFKSFDGSDEGEGFLPPKKKTSFSKINFQGPLLQSEQLQVFKEGGMYQSQKLRFNRGLNRKTTEINLGSQQKQLQQIQKSSTQVLLRKLRKLKDLVHNYDGHQIIDSLCNDLANFEENKIEEQLQNIKDKQGTNYQSTYSGDSDFSVDQMCNYENFYPKQNPQLVVREIRKQQQKKRSQYFRRSKFF